MFIVWVIYLILNAFYVNWIMNCNDSFLNRANRVCPYTLNLKEVIMAMMHEITIIELILLFIFPIPLIILTVSIIFIALLAGIIYLVKAIISLWNGNNILKVVKIGLKSFWNLLLKRPFAKKEKNKINIIK